ncbi:EamA family transporter [Erwinia psidii]|uniref:EamA family transporter n=1 Tax=Erwinia psidii TaxID=69224 RepID=A0A3N6SHQ8_9GAMM|nr:EamA family transporter [Erwinia psidii]MCX8957292.1 EamA family transporter [Erwinia psidii]MCX8959663.1 EamA family transporter [Erwinia psidii]MCX8964607.1 EamA family transporter [Erwinia psidii]RQM38281.1 EamA family transporter [Erwinia psidii]
MNKLSTLGNILITALAPVIWGSTYIVTTQTLPPHVPLLASVIRALVAGLILLLVCRVRPYGIWWLRIAILGFLNIGLFFYCLFAAAYFLPGGLASLVMSCQPVIVMVIGAVVFRHKLRAIHIISAVIGVTGISLLVLNSAVTLNFQGVAIGLVGTTSMAMGILLTKYWGRPHNMSLLAFTGWQLTMGGLMLLPAALTLEKLPAALTFTNLLGYGWLTLAGGVLGYFIWFRGIEKLPPVTTSFLGFMSSLSACVLGYVILGQTFTHLQLVGCLAIITSIYLARPSRRNKAEPQAVSGSRQENLTNSVKRRC